MISRDFEVVVIVRDCLLPRLDLVRGDVIAASGHRDVDRLCR